MHYQNYTFAEPFCQCKFNAAFQWCERTAHQFMCLIQFGFNANTIIVSEAIIGWKYFCFACYVKCHSKWSLVFVLLMWLIKLCLFLTISNNKSGSCNFRRIQFSSTQVWVVKCDKLSTAGSQPDVAIHSYVPPFSVVIYCYIAGRIKWLATSNHLMWDAISVTINHICWCINQNKHGSISWRLQDRVKFKVNFQLISMFANNDHTGYGNFILFNT